QGFHFRHAIQSHDTAQFPRGIFLERLRASDTEKSQQDVGHQRGAQAVERGTQAFVNLLGGGQQSTGHQRRNGQQNSSPRQVLCRSKQRLRVVESSQGGQQTIQGTVQRVRIEARSCWFGLGRFLKNCLWCLWGRNGICRAFRNRGRWSGRIGPGQKRSEEHTSELQSRSDLVCRLLLEKKKK